MPTYTRKAYRDIGSTLRKLPKKVRREQTDVWIRKFASDNPRFQKSTFKRFVETGRERAVKKAKKPATRRASKGFFDRLM